MELSARSRCFAVAATMMFLLFLVFQSQTLDTSEFSKEHQGTQGASKVRQDESSAMKDLQQKYETLEEKYLISEQKKNPASSQAINSSDETYINPDFDEKKLKSQRPLVIAYYYLWYGKEHHPWDLLKRREDPLVGYYDSIDPEVVALHIDWAVDNGIEAFCISLEPAKARILYKTLIQVRNINKIKIVLHYETHLAMEEPNVAAAYMEELGQKVLVDSYVLRLDNKKIAKFAGESLRAALDIFYKEPWYLRVDDRPALVIYISRNWCCNTDQQKDFVDVYLGDTFTIADHVWWKNTPQQAGIAATPVWDKNGKSVFDAYTCYNLYEPAPSGTDVTMNQKWYNAWLEASGGYDLVADWAKEVNVIPPLMPRYYDFRQSAVPTHPELSGTPDTFREQIRNMMNIPQRPLSKDYSSAYFVVSFNEYWEGSGVEPTVQFGFQYLDVIREVFAPWLPKPVNAIRELRNKFPSYRDKMYADPEFPREDSAHKGLYLSSWRSRN